MAQPGASFPTGADEAGVPPAVHSPKQEPPPVVVGRLDVIESRPADEEEWMTRSKPADEESGGKRAAPVQTSVEAKSFLSAALRLRVCQRRWISWHVRRVGLRARRRASERPRCGIDENRCACHLIR